MKCKQAQKWDEKMSQKIKKRTFEILELSNSGDKPSRIFDIFIISLITLNVICVILETVNSISLQYKAIFEIFEIVSVIIFTVEYLLRIWSCTSTEKYKHPVSGRFKFAFSFMLLIDLIAILPFYIPLIITLDLRFIRALRLLRLFRLFKMGRYSKSLKMLGNVIKARKEEMLITVFVLSIMLIVASSLMYYIEKDAQPQHFSSIPAAMWWGVATLTTVGYGDVFPVTNLGKILSAVMAVLGIGIFALPTGILASGFIEEIKKKGNKPIVCPHCGENID